MNYAKKILKQAVERNTLLMETEIQNSGKPEVYRFAKNIEHLGQALAALESVEEACEAIIEQAKQTARAYDQDSSNDCTIPTRWQDELTDKARAFLTKQGKQ